MTEKPTKMYDDSTAKEDESEEEANISKYFDAENPDNVIPSPIATSIKQCSNDTGLKEDKNDDDEFHLPDVPNEENELEFNLPDVPDEIPGEIKPEDPDNDLHTRLRMLKKFRRKHEKKIILKEAQYKEPVQKYPFEEKAGGQQGTKPDLGKMMNKFRTNEVFEEKDNMPVNKAMKQVDEDNRVIFKKHRNMNDVDTKDMISYTVLVVLAVLMMIPKLVPRQQRFKEEHNCDKMCRMKKMSWNYSYQMSLMKFQEI